MALNRRSIEMLLDLVDNKLTSMQVIDREDAREMALLEAAKRELEALAGVKRATSVVSIETAHRPAQRMAV
ncbi:MAG TPA: hypothetical protein VJ924_12735 [Alphaproteobacteria bacterium]|nr:hypothetical protein [Alphaproteobacteria bacterium]